MLAIVCPGQGSQSPGFLTPWLEVDGVRDGVTTLVNCSAIAPGCADTYFVMNRVKTCGPLPVSHS